MQFVSVFVTASYGHYGQHTARIGPDRICWIQLPTSDLVPFFQRKPGPYCAKLTRIRSGWPGQVWDKCIWSRSKPVRKNHFAQFLAESNQPTTSFSLLDSVVFSHRLSRSHCAKPGQIQFDSGWLCHILVKWILSGRKPVCKNHPAHFWANPDRTWIGCGMFTGIPPPLSLCAQNVLVCACD